MKLQREGGERESKHRDRGLEKREGELEKEGGEKRPKVRERERERVRLVAVEGRGKTQNNAAPYGLKAVTISLPAVLSALALSAWRGSPAVPREICYLSTCRVWSACAV